MLMPKRVKWRKQQRGHMRGKALRGVSLQARKGVGAEQRLIAVEAT